LTWVAVAGGESGAVVLRSPDGTRYAKRGPGLAEERDRIAWLSTTGVPGPAVVDWQDDGPCLVMSAVPGVPADQVGPDALWRAWPNIAAAVRELHALTDCPYSRDLTTMLALASDVVARDAVNREWLPEEQHGTPPTQLLALLLASQPPDEDTVVCHGDLCLPNIMLDPESSEVTGFIDLGRLGTADRYADIALLLANARETWRTPDEAGAADEAFAQAYGIALDTARQRFYLHLDPLTWG
jgi:streptomycin 3"-kinase